MTDRSAPLSTRELRALLDDPRVQIVDVRPIDAYNGWRLRGEARGGHIHPGRALSPRQVVRVHGLDRDRPRQGDPPREDGRRLRPRREGDRGCGPALRSGRIRGRTRVPRLRGRLVRLRGAPDGAPAEVQAPGPGRVAEGGPGRRGRPRARRERGRAVPRPLPQPQRLRAGPHPRRRGPGHPPAGVARDLEPALPRRGAGRAPGAGHQGGPSTDASRFPTTPIPFRGAPPGTWARSGAPSSCCGPA